MLEEVRAELQSLEKSLAAWELQRMLSGPYDSGPAVLSIHAGAGGDDAMDWAAMLERMYLRYFEAKGWVMHVADRAQGEVAGIKSVDMQVRGLIHQCIRTTLCHASHPNQYICLDTLCFVGFERHFSHSYTWAL